MTTRVPTAAIALKCSSMRFRGVERAPILTRKAVLNQQSRVGLDSAAELASIATTVESVFENATYALRRYKASQHTYSSINGKEVTQIFSASSASFGLLSAVSSVYSSVADLFGFANAYRKNYYETARDKILSFFANGSSASASGVSSAASIYKLNGAAAQAAMLGAVASFLAVGVFALYSAIQVLFIRRITKCVGVIHAHLNQGKSELDGVKAALNGLYDLVDLSDADLQKIHKKLGHTNFDDQFFAEVKKRLELKYEKLEKRVGAEVAARIKYGIDHLLRVLERSKDEKEKALALKEAKEIFSAYKASLYKALQVRIYHFVGGVLGTVGSVLSIFTPPGAAIASGILLALASVAILNAWYGNKFWKEEDFSEGINFLGRRLSKVKVPDLIESVSKRRFKEKEATIGIMTPIGEIRLRACATSA